MDCSWFGDLYKLENVVMTLAEHSPCVQGGGLDSYPSSVAGAALAKMHLASSEVNSWCGHSHTQDRGCKSFMILCWCGRKTSNDQVEVLSWLEIAEAIQVLGNRM